MGGWWAMWFCACEQRSAEAGGVRRATEADTATRSSQNMSVARTQGAHGYERACMLQRVAHLAPAERLANLKVVDPPLGGGRLGGGRDDVGGRFVARLGVRGRSGLWVRGWRRRRSGRGRRLGRCHRRLRRDSGSQRVGGGSRRIEGRLDDWARGGRHVGGDVAQHALGAAAELGHGAAAHNGERPSNPGRARRPLGPPRTDPTPPPLPITRGATRELRERERPTKGEPNKAACRTAS